MMIVDYEISKECKNNEAVYYICYKCGKCGRKFVNGFMVDDNYNIVDSWKSWDVICESKHTTYSK